MVERFIVLLRHFPYAIKNQLGHPKPPTRGSSLVLYGIRDSWLPCTERSYHRRPYAIKNQRGGGFGCDELVLYGKRELAWQFLGSNLDIEVENSVVYGVVVLVILIVLHNWPE